jgi:hypothetical protein
MRRGSSLLRDKEEKVKGLIWQLVAPVESIQRVDAQFIPEEEFVDLTFLVEGDLFTSERQVLPLMGDLRHAFPKVAFDLVILRAGSRKEPEGFKRIDETIFERSA